MSLIEQVLLYLKALLSSREFKILKILCKSIPIMAPIQIDISVLSV